MSSPSDGQLEGIRAQMRLLVSHPPEQRFTAEGAEVLQVRGTVMDKHHGHPMTVVRFAGQRQAELYRWAVPGKHLAVDGYLEVKVWGARDGDNQPLMALLIEAVNVTPLSEARPDPSRAAIYDQTPRRGAAVTRTPLSKGERAEQMRKALFDA